MAEAALSQLELDELWLIPARQSPFKERPQASDAHRLEMLALATHGLPRTRIDQRELTRKGASYTIDTLHSIHQQHTNTELFLILGQDAWGEFEIWHRWQAILDLAQVAVVNRPDAAPPPHHLPYTPLEMPANTASSTEVRTRIASGELLIGLVPETVSQYITAHRLYA